MSNNKDTSTSRNNTKSVAKKHTNDDEDTYYSRSSDDDEQQTKTTSDSPDDRNPSNTTASADVQEWRCRECGSINEENDTVCETCNTRKPMRPRLKVRFSRPERRPSSSSSDRHSSSEEEETIFNQAMSPSSLSIYHQNSSPEQSPSTRYSSTHERSRRKSSSTSSSDDSQYLLSRNTKTQSRLYTDSSEEQSLPRGREHLEDDYRSGNKKSPSNRSTSTHQSYESNKSDNRDYVSFTTSKQDRSARTTTKQRQSSESSSSSETSNRDKSIVVYVPDLPPTIESNQSIEDMIRQCLELKHKQRILNIKCNIQLGIGIIYLHSNKDKHNLLKIIGKILIEPKSNTTVSFVDELELISYVVVHANDTKDLPSTNEICRRWIQLYKIHSQPTCENLSVQFPNIFRLVIYSLDELIHCMSMKEFSINNLLAKIYFRADCCFFEDLPATTNVDRLRLAISQQISDKYMSNEFIHIQYNKDSNNAVILTSGTTRIWSLYNSIRLDGREIMKKDSLACRLLIRNVPKNLPTSLIQDHHIFGNSIVKLFSSNEHIILELSDRNIYEQCINQRTLTINGHVLNIEVYRFSSEYKDQEIDAENWYETEMCDHKADIMLFVSNPQHFIFQFKWNSEAFLKQFRHWKSNKRSSNDKLCDLKFHLLRMTVMLNTIGIVRKGSYRIGEKEIKLKPDRLKTIVYNHNSKLQSRKTVSLSSITEFPFASTSIKVINEDCLIIYKDLVSKGHRPVLLNMTNANNPGGGYKRGDGAQEETLFRRSNYYQSLDLTLDDDKPSARFYCNSNCDLESLAENDQLYPMDEFGAIYTSGLTVFRLPEDTGYTLMDIPMYNVCSIAMAAYRDPKLNKKNLSSKYSIGTRKKIENIFAIAYHHKHDSLVLSALGCGAFRNPPEHIAKIFQSVIEQYAGYFKYIYFAIIDDHNSGQNLNPNGNYRPFQKLLDNLDIEPNKRPKTTVDMMIGPWRILNQTTKNEIRLSDIQICYLPPCHDGGKCDDFKNDRHCREYSHPPLCSSGDNGTSCKETNDDQHMLWFRHRPNCSKGGQCQLIENDATHSNEFQHPEFCRDAGRCENTDRQHLKSYRHVPVCKYRQKCVEYNRGSSEHCQKFRHCMSVCRFGHFCVRFHDTNHMNEENHPFQPPCPFTPFHCRAYNTLNQAKHIKSLPIDVQNHCLKYSHVCRFGRHCRENDETHWKTTIHVARHICPHGNKCTKTQQEDHLNSFTHPGIPDIRRLCDHQAYECRDRRKAEHITQYRHHGKHDRSGAIASFGLNKDINFVENQENMIRAIQTYATSLNAKSKLIIPSEIQKFIKGLQPVHRCSNAIFESILVHGHIMSRKYMELLQNPHFAAQAVQEHKRVRAIFDRHKLATIEDHAKKYIRAIVSYEYYKSKKATLMAMGLIAAPPSTTSTSDPPDDDKDDNTIRLAERVLKSMLRPEEISTIKKCAIDIAAASINLYNIPAGIGYPPDKLLGTDKHIFSILGPNLGHYYGDIILVIKSEVMLHPDTNFTPQAGTSFITGTIFPYRPWFKDPGTTEGRVECFHNSKLHCSVPGYEYAAAAELIAATGHKKKTMNVDLEAILKHWRGTDSHGLFEAHLPQLVSLDYVDEVYIPKNLFALLTPVAQQSAKRIFRDSLHITHHEVSLNRTTNFGPRPLDKSHADYQDYVVNKLIEKFEKRIERAGHFFGTVITLTPSQFTDHIVTPLTIKDAYNLYRQTHKRDQKSDHVYIYWQAMYGDMMITLSNQSIDPDINQPGIRCLVCYIAKTPSTTTTTTNYNESYSYLNAGEPYRHSVIMNNNRCSASLLSFHLGCNIEDFLTYCLKIEKKTGQVTLSHAGSNSVYCSQTIQCKFSKTNFNLSKLNYIHVSAGSQKVPIRNLIISFKPISDLHPSFDESYKHDNSTSLDKEKSSSVLSKAAHAIGSLFGDDDEKREPCPNSTKCQLQNSSKHIKEYSHPCPNGKHCRNKDKEPHLTHDDSNDRHKGHRTKSETRETSGKSSKTPDSKYEQKKDERTVCRYGRDCQEKNDAQHCSKYRHPDEHRSKSSSRSNDERVPCRLGRDCRDKDDRQHCAKYSHPVRSKSKGPDKDRKPCMHGRNCHDKNDPKHCSKYSHSKE